MERDTWIEEKGEEVVVMVARDVDDALRLTTPVVFVTTLIPEREDVVLEEEEEEEETKAGRRTDARYPHTVGMTHVEFGTGVGDERACAMPICGADV